jgi:hypothetical protein
VPIEGPYKPAQYRYWEMELEAKRDWKRRYCFFCIFMMICPILLGFNFFPRICVLGKTWEENIWNGLSWRPHGII